MEDKEGLGYISEIFTQSRDSIPDDMHVTEENKDTIKAELMNFYTSGGNYVDNPRKLVTLMSDHDFVKSVLKFAEQLVKTLAKPIPLPFLLQRLSWVFTEISQLVVGVGVRSFSITDSCTPELTQTVPYFHWIQFFIKLISMSSSSYEATIENNGNDLQFIADEIAIAPIIFQKSQVPKIKMRKDDA
ncbi:unnamed protein product [Acanthoscelides obtectus]|uniref:Uncharacterized protein n=2 Tax=Acanthoscelides obtectus TaxID=200917 RepID=A0A9P0MJ38_ACAOB|nr:unnamed protein product [Acanthoscelides obtectus]CAK1683585.1 hypothetical protein AOBTE_LOCUS34340 [Acanthoscelides obtectus]